MKRLWKIALCLLLTTVTLSACSGATPPSGNGGAVYDQATQYLGPTATPSPAPTQPPVSSGGDPSIFSANPYDVTDGFTADDAMGEEDYIDPAINGDTALSALQANAGGTEYPYAGSTPIPLDPIDMPSPTPHPELSFTYASYTAGSLGVTFEAPSGWIVDDSQTEVFMVTEPDSQMHDGKQCVITISAMPVNSNYSERDLKSEVTDRLKTISAVNFSEWKPSLTATRYLMGSKGVYANYTGTRADGVKLGGRIHYACVNNMLYGVEIDFPLEYKDDYLNVFAKIRETLKAQ